MSGGGTDRWAAAVFRRRTEFLWNKTRPMDWDGVWHLTDKCRSEAAAAPAATALATLLTLLFLPAFYLAWDQAAGTRFRRVSALCHDSEPTGTRRVAGNKRADSSNWLSLE